MKQFKSRSIFFSIGASLLFYSCSRAPVPVYGSSAQRGSASHQDIDSTEYQKTVFGQYCNGGRQVKKLSYSIRLIKPKLPRGKALDRASQSIEEITNINQCLVKTSAIALSNHCGDKLNCHNFYQTSDSAQDVAKYAKEMIYENGTAEYCKMGSCAESGPMRPIFLYTGESQPILLLYEKTERRNRPGGFGWYVSKYDGDGSAQQAFLSELTTLRRGYTILLTSPIEEGTWMDYVNLQSDICSPEKWTNGSYRYLAQGWSIDGGTLSPSDALSKKDLIWKRYLVANSSIKEAVSNDSQIVNYEVSVDLNGFCKFGRHTDDLLSY